MSNFYGTKKDKVVTYKEIVLENYKFISEMFRTEFKEGYNTYISTGNIVTETRIGDKRIEFIQSVEGLALTLMPHFDKIMTEDYKEYLKAKKETEEEKNADKKNLKILDAVKSLYANLSFLLSRRKVLELGHSPGVSKGEQNMGDDEGGISNVGV